jgi:hypothetical protein
VTSLGPRPKLKLFWNGTLIRFATGFCVSLSWATRTQRDSSAIIRRVLDDQPLVEQLRTMPRGQAYNYLFIRLCLEPHEAEAILKECFPSASAVACGCRWTLQQVSILIGSMRGREGGASLGQLHRLSHLELSGTRFSAGRNAKDEIGTMFQLSRTD